MAPMYDYVCKSCGKEYPDKLVSYSEKDNQICSECGKELTLDITSCKPTLIGVG